MAGVIRFLSKGRFFSFLKSLSLSFGNGNGTGEWNSLGVFPLGYSSVVWKEGREMWLQEGWHCWPSTSLWLFVCPCLALFTQQVRDKCLLETFFPKLQLKLWLPYEATPDISSPNWYLPISKLLMLRLHSLALILHWFVAVVSSGSLTSRWAARTGALSWQSFLACGASVSAIQQLATLRTSGLCTLEP